MYIKFSPNQYVIRYKNGKVRSEGIGLAFFYMNHNTSACAVPIANQDADFIFEELTKDYQTISVQGQITYKIKDYKKISEAMDFTVDLKTKQYGFNPIPKLSKRIINIAEVSVKKSIGDIGLTEAIQASREIAEKVYEDIKANTELQNLGIGIEGFSILRITANADTARALEAKTRESILKDSDDALYERRNAAIDQERKVKENELNTEIKIEEKKKIIKETEIQTKRSVFEKESELAKLQAESEAERLKIETDAELALAKIKAEGEAQRLQIEIDAQIAAERKKKELAELRLENAKKDADAESYRIAAVMEAYGKISSEVIVALANLNTEPEKMIAQAFNGLATNSEKIGQLNITPDLLESLTSGKGTV